MNKAQALARIVAEPREVPAGQKYQVDRFRPEDAWGVARLFHAIYGADYPVDTTYVPEKLIKANEDQDLLSLVGRTEADDVVAHYALYRSSPPNRNLYEIGQMLILPDYRNSMLAFRLNQRAIQVMEETPGIHGLFGEAVCSHVITQKFINKVGFREIGLEPALMPEGAYAKEGTPGRVGCVSAVRIKPGKRRPLFVPARYQAHLAFLLEGVGLDRDLQPSRAGIPAGSVSEIKSQRFDFAAVARLNILSCGADLAQEVARAESGDPAVVQVYLNLGQPWVEEAVEILFARGYFLGGFLPIWLGDDALMMQKLTVDPEFEAMQLLNERGQRIRDMVREDWERVTRG